MTNKQRENLLWKVYLVVMLGITVWTLFSLPQAPDEIFGLLVSIVGLIGIFGFSF
jgi:hypothetical protein